MSREILKFFARLQAPILFSTMLALLTAPWANAGTISLVAGLEANKTSWSGDKVGAGTLRGAYRWNSWGAYFQTELGFGAVDDRILQHLELGAQYRHPLGEQYVFARAGLIHLHEISGEALSSDATAVLGFGDGIRHRGGLASAVGLIIPLKSLDNGEVFVSLEVNSDYLIGAAGPDWYWGGGLGLGLTYDLGGTVN